MNGNSVDEPQTATTVRAHFRRQAAACRDLDSPFTARVLDLVAARLSNDTRIGRRILGWPGDPGEDALALRLAGGLHALVLSEAAAPLAAVYPGGAQEGDIDALWPAVADALGDHETMLGRFLDSPPQTNEVGRSAILAAGFLTIAALTGRPLALHEIGASAGLNLLWDHYAYEFGGAAWGREDAPVRVSPKWDGPAPPLGAVTVASRAGCDARPLDPRDEDHRLRLRAYVWPDQRARLQRLEGALAAAAAGDTRVARADAASWLPEQVADRAAGMTTVVYHSVVWQYLPAETQAAVQAAMCAAAGRADDGAPLAWLRMEPGPEPFAAELRLSLWPDGPKDRRLARVDYHGRWVDWVGAA